MSRWLNAAVDIGNWGLSSLEEKAWADNTREEVSGFTWEVVGDTSWGAASSTGKVIKYRVVNIRKSGGRVWAAVRTSHDAVQLDHSLAEIREKMYFAKVGHAFRQLPLVLRYQQFQGSSFFVDLGVIYNSAEYYTNTVR